MHFMYTWKDRKNSPTVKLSTTMHWYEKSTRVIYSRTVDMENNKDVCLGII